MLLLDLKVAAGMDREEEEVGWLDWIGQDEAVDWLAVDPEGKTKRRQGGGFCGGGEEMIDGIA